MKRRKRMVRTLAFCGVGLPALLSSGVASAEEPSAFESTAYVAKYASATWQTEGATVTASPGEETYQGQTTDVLDVTIETERCRFGMLVTTELQASERGALPGVTVDPLQGSASVGRTTMFSGTETITPAGWGCKSPKWSRSTSKPVSRQVTLNLAWANAAGSEPVTYSGEDCGNTGICYYRDAVASGMATVAGGGFLQPPQHLTLGDTSDAWLWAGAYDIPPDM